MPFFMNGQRSLIAEAARRFAVKELRPRAREIDRSDEFPIELFRRCGELGFLGLTLPEEHGGSGTGQVFFDDVRVPDTQRIGPRDMVDRGENVYPTVFTLNPHAFSVAEEICTAEMAWWPTPASSSSGVTPRWA